MRGEAHFGHGSFARRLLPRHCSLSFAFVFVESSCDCGKTYPRRGKSGIPVSVLAWFAFSQHCNLFLLHPQLACDLLSQLLPSVLPAPALSLYHQQDHVHCPVKCLNAFRLTAVEWIHHHLANNPIYIYLYLSHGLL